jgi:hypothetical protein
MSSHDCTVPEIEFVLTAGHLLTRGTGISSEVDGVMLVLIKMEGCVWIFIPVCFAGE